MPHPPPPGPEPWDPFHPDPKDPFDEIPKPEQPEPQIWAPSERSIVGDTFLCTLFASNEFQRMSLENEDGSVVYRHWKLSNRWLESKDEERALTFWLRLNNTVAAERQMELAPEIVSDAYLPSGEYWLCYRTSRIALVYDPQQCMITLPTMAEYHDEIPLAYTVRTYETPRVELIGQGLTITLDMEAGPMNTRLNVDNVRDSPGVLDASADKIPPGRYYLRVGDAASPPFSVQLMAFIINDFTMSYANVSVPFAVYTIFNCTIRTRQEFHAKDGSVSSVKEHEYNVVGDDIDRTQVLKPFPFKVRTLRSRTSTALAR